MVRAQRNVKRVAEREGKKECARVRDREGTLEPGRKRPYNHDTWRTGSDEKQYGGDDATQKAAHTGIQRCQTH